MKLIVDMLEQADAECEELSGIREQYHAAHTAAEVLRTQLRQHRSIDIAIDIFFAVFMAIGGTVLGLVTSLPDNLKAAGWVLGIGQLLLGAAAKVVRSLVR